MDSLPTKALTIINKGRRKTVPLQHYGYFLQTQKWHENFALQLPRFETVVSNNIVQRKLWSYFYRVVLVLRKTEAPVGIFYSFLLSLSCFITSSQRPPPHSRANKVSMFPFIWNPSSQVQITWLDQIRSNWLVQINLSEGDCSTFRRGGRSVLMDGYIFDFPAFYK